MRTKFFLNTRSIVLSLFSLNLVHFLTRNQTIVQDADAEVFFFVIGTLALGGMANAGYLSTCDVVRSLRAASVPESEIRDCKSIT